MYGILFTGFRQVPAQHVCFVIILWYKKYHSIFVRIKPQLKKGLFKVCGTYIKILFGIEQNFITVR